MTDRSDRVPLAAKEARCYASQKCVMKLSCARWLATIPHPGGTVGDWSIDTGNAGGTLLCRGFINVAMVRATASAQTAPRKVHPPL